MKADYTRLTFNREKHYNGVRMQQGRVQVDADWNEQMDIQAHLRNTQSTDVVGACGAPRLNGGFKIEALGDKSDLSISPGRMYVGGRLCELEETLSVGVTALDAANNTLRTPFLSADGKILFEPQHWIEIIADGLEPLIAQITKIEEKTANNSTYLEATIDPGEADLSVFEGAEGLHIRRIISYKAQTSYPYDPDTDAPTDAGLYAAYLDVWERHITAIEDATIREVALGGPDTATRTQTLWQVKLMKVDDTNSAGAPLTCWDTPSPWAELPEQSKGLMSARAAASESETRPCIISAAVGYRRLENQLYRVEIHKSGKAGTATFKWSRDNGIVVSRVEQIIAGKRALVVSNAGRDTVLSFGTGQWVELIDEERVLRGEPGLLLKLAPGEENTLVVDEATWNDIKNKDYRDEILAIDLSKTLVTVRRWDQKSSSSEEGAALVDGAVPVPSDTTKEVDLEEGVKVRFHGGDENYYYNTGDYWLIPARTVGGDVEWPKDGSKNPIPQPPHGIYHHYCKLALVDWDGTNFTVRHDCRPLFPALNEPDLVYVSGDGQEAMPGDHLPQPLRVCVYNCNEPVKGAWIKFEIVKEGDDGNGCLEWIDKEEAPAVIAGSDPNEDCRKWFIVATDRSGEAECTWNIRNFSDEDTRKELEELPAQQVMATLLRDANDANSKLDRPVVFSASFGVAWEDRYAGSAFPDDQHADLIVHTVEDALDQLRENVALYYVSGDGQEAKRLYVKENGGWVLQREQLKQSLVVRAANGDWPFGNAEVKFKITGGNGSIQPAAGYETVGDPIMLDGRTIEFVVKTKTDGLAECLWELDGDTDSQQVTATLENTISAETDDENFVVFPSDVRFNANLSIAEEVTYDGSNFPDIQHPGLVIHTVENALDQSRENTALHYVGGDGQEARRGERLPQQLQVRVANGQWPRENALVRFIAHSGNFEDAEETETTIHSDGQHYAEVRTNKHGIAEIYWRLDGSIAGDGSSIPSQQVTAILVDPVQLPVDPDALLDPTKPSPGVIHFTANLSIAEEVTYDGSAFPDEQYPVTSEDPGLVVDTVEDALDQLRQNVALYYVSGDGQEARRGEYVPMPLQVRVANGDWPFSGATVKFEISTAAVYTDDSPDDISGYGTISPIDGAVDVEELAWGHREQLIAFSVKTNEDGLAECLLLLDGKNPNQQVTASLMSTLDPETGNVMVFPSEVRFNATSSIAKEVTYDGARFPETQHQKLTAHDVEKALDQLRENIALYYVGGDGQEIARYPQDSIIAFPGPVVPGPGLIAPVPSPIVPGSGPIAPVLGPIVPEPGPIAPVPGPGPVLPGPIVSGPMIDTRFSEIAVDKPLVNFVFVTKELPKRLQVRAANGDWPFQSAVVEFRITEGKGDIQPVKGVLAEGVEKEFGRVIAFTVKTDSTGLAECRWRLDPETPSQQVAASLVARLGETAASGVVFPSDVRFNAILSTADEVSYSAPAGKTADTVQAGLDDLYATKLDKAGGTITGDLAVEGNFKVHGEWTKVNVKEMVVEDPVLTINRFEGASNPSLSCGIEVYRGMDEATPHILWDETLKSWKLGFQDNSVFFVDAEGKVGIGAPAQYEKLEVSGNVKAEKFIGDGSQLTGIAAGLWKIGANGAIYYDGGNVGIGTPGPAFRFHQVGGDHVIENAEISLRRDNFHRWKLHELAAAGFRITQGYNDAHVMLNAVRLAISDSGNVGIGTKDPKAQLSIVASGATDLAGTAKSSTLNSSAGRLGSKQFDELSLASFGFQSENHCSLGIRAYRVANGGDWRTTAIGLGMDVDNTVRAGGASVWLNANGNVGIGTNNAAQRLHVYGESNPTILRVQSAGTFGAARLEFWSDPRTSVNEWRPGFIQSTDNGTFTGGLAFFVNGTGTDAKTGEREVMRLVNGKVGIGTADPKAELHVQGQIYATGAIFYNNTLNSVSDSTQISSSNDNFTYLPGMAVPVYVPRNARLAVQIKLFSLTVTAPILTTGRVNFRVLLDGAPISIIGGYSLSGGLVGSSQTWNNITLNTAFDVSEGAHTIYLQWSVTGSLGFIHASAQLTGQNIMTVQV